MVKHVLCINFSKPVGFPAGFLIAEGSHTAQANAQFGMIRALAYMETSAKKDLLFPMQRFYDSSL